MIRGLYRLMILSFLLFLFSCEFTFHELNNPVDSNAQNYQGYPTVGKLTDIDVLDEIVYWDKISLTDCVEASKYQLQISNLNTDFSSPIIDVESLTNTIEFNNESITEGLFICRVRGQNDNNVWGEWSDIQELTLSSGITTISPSKNEAITEREPLLEWNDIESAATYQIQYGINTINISSNSLNTTTISEYEFPEILIPNDRVNWRIRAINEDGDLGYWTAINTFTKILAVGDRFAGGFIFYYDKDNGSGLVVEDGPNSTAGRWGPIGGSITGVTNSGVGDGKLNSETLYAMSSTDFWIVGMCLSSNEEGYSDWFLPSKDSLILINDEVISKGLFSFPPSGILWSSTESTIDKAWGLNIDNDRLEAVEKTTSGTPIAVREFSID